MIKNESSIELLSFLIILNSILGKVDTLLPLLTTSTPACSAGNCRPDPPPNPRLGGGCVPLL
ncbi:MAG: hypothetical protein IKC92_04700, partial [Tidjanibacter sp.]|nr:hypothetical protein [Tidjanibacter sp.]